MIEDRMFTVGEANNLVPELESNMREIQRVRRFVVGIRKEIQKARDKITSNGGSTKGPSYLRALEHIMKRVENIQRKGILVKDLEKGLCDFPFMLDGRVVYLCWRVGEAEVGWWHETDTGFSHRQPLDEDE